MREVQQALNGPSSAARCRGRGSFGQSSPPVRRTGRESTPEALVTTLQRQAGNRAVSGYLGVAPRVQRISGVSKPKIGDADLVSLTISLTPLVAHVGPITTLADNPQVIRDLALRYGLTPIGPSDTARTMRVPAHVKPLVDAATKVGTDVGSGPGAKAALSGTFNDKNVKRKLASALRDIFDPVAAVWKVWSSLYGEQPAGYAHRGGLVGGPLNAMADSSPTVLPARDVVSVTPGLIGQRLRQLCDPAFNGQPIDTAAVDALYLAFNQSTWEYDPTLSPSAHDLILGHSNKAVCGAFAGALVELVNLVAKCRSVPNPANRRSRPTPFVTVPYQWGYIDPGVPGNVMSIEGGATDYAGTNRAFFIGHTWMEALGHTYDPLGKQRDVDFSDNTLGAFQLVSNEPGVRARSDTWELLTVPTPPPKAFGQGYRLQRIH